ncbi:MAG: phage terminase large subunit [Acidobacteriota bacterium]
MKRKDSHDDVFRLARASLASYAPLVFPSYQVYKHHSLLMRKLEAVEAGKIRRLMIFMPPRMGKSCTTSEIFPAWYLGRHPDRSIITASYSQEFVEGFGRKVRNYAADPRTRAVFPELQLAEDSQSVRRFDTTAGGSYFAVGRGGAITGRGGHLLLIDDPIKDMEEARSETIRRQLHDWYSSVLYTRRQPETAIVLVQTRWHCDDLAGHLLREQPEENWEILNLPAIAEVDEGWRKPGAALWPERFPLEELESTRRVLGSAAWSALYQQRPVPEEGAIFKAEWWQRYDELPEFSQIILSADTAFKAGAANDYSVVTVWGVAKNGFYLLHVWRARAEFPQLKRQLESMGAQFNPHVVLVEDKASGQSLIQELRQSTRLPIRPVKVDADKVTRAHAVSPLVEAGRVFLPKAAPWLADFLDELATFPSGAHDDIVDSTTQALNYLRIANVSYGLLDAMKALSGNSQVVAELLRPAKATQAPAKPAEEPERPSCPAHPSAALQRLSQALRCPQCGQQWVWPPRKPEPIYAPLVRRV